RGHEHTGRARARRPPRAAGPGANGLEKGHPNAHVGDDAPVARLDGDGTFTVALLRSAVGMMAMTLPGIFHSGYALSVLSTGWPDCTRPMYASFTSTSISSEFMSTMVPIPVRVKPPPADM